MRSRIFVHDLFPRRCYQLTRMERSKFFLLRCKQRLGLHSEFAPKIVANVPCQQSPRPRSLLLAWKPPTMAVSVSYALGVKGGEFSGGFSGFLSVTGRD